MQTEILRYCCFHAFGHNRPPTPHALHGAGIFKLHLHGFNFRTMSKQHTAGAALSNSIYALSMSPADSRARTYHGCDCAMTLVIVGLEHH